MQSMKNFSIIKFILTPIIFKRYGIDNVHLVDTTQFQSTSVRLNITADEPVSSSSYNYTELLTSF